jgi:hypothetical protein
MGDKFLNFFYFMFVKNLEEIKIVVRGEKFFVANKWLKIKFLLNTRKKIQESDAK